jgi:glycosyltransferase involved in cell wall biosynthesis
MNPTNSLPTEKIIIFDTVIIGNNHLVVNSGIVNMAQQLFSKGSLYNELIFNGETTHFDILSTLIDKKVGIAFTLHPIQIIHPSTGKIQNIVSWLKKLREDQKNLKELLATASEPEVKLVIVSCIISINLFRLFSKIKHKKTPKFLVVVHGEVEYLFKQQLTLKEKIYRFFLEKSFNRLPSNTRLIVFSDVLKLALLQKFHYQDQQVISINHPIQKFERLNCTISNCVTFSHLGVANKRKNSDFTFKLANLFSEQVHAGRCKFSIIGRVEENEMQYSSPYVTVESKGNDAIPNDIYLKMISKSDYSLIFLPQDEYVYRTSGSLLDSIQFQLPIIALQHGFVSELFEKGGDIGFICADFAQMTEVIKQICNNNPSYVERYSQQVSNLRQLSNEFYCDKSAQIIEHNLSSWIN